MFDSRLEPFFVEPIHGLVLLDVLAAAGSVPHNQIKLNKLRFNPISKLPNPL
jgi:hypothetical protein